VLVYYDRVISKKTDARVVAIEFQLVKDIEELPQAMGSLVERLGPPTSGGEFLEGGLRAGVARWLDPQCDVRVEAFRRVPGWWQPTEQTRFYIRIELGDRSRLATSRK
jgi:hypothetical protein